MLQKIIKLNRQSRYTKKQRKCGPFNSEDHANEVLGNQLEKLKQDVNFDMF